MPSEANEYRTRLLNAVGAGEEETIINEMHANRVRVMGDRLLRREAHFYDGSAIAMVRDPNGKLLVQAVDEYVGIAVDVHNDFVSMEVDIMEDDE